MGSQEDNIKKEMKQYGELSLPPLKVCDRNGKEIHRNYSHKKGCRHRVIMMDDDGRITLFEFCSEAARAVGGYETLVRRCCDKNDGLFLWTPKEDCGTDYRYKDMRFYWEASNVWVPKIGVKLTLIENKEDNDEQ